MYCRSVSSQQFCLALCYKNLCEEILAHLQFTDIKWKNKKRRFKSVWMSVGISSPSPDVHLEIERALSKNFLKVWCHEHLGSLLQCPSTLLVKSLFLTSSLTLPCWSFMPFLWVLSLVTKEKRSDYYKIWSDILGFLSIFSE